jgi:hypothetical protein
VLDLLGYDDGGESPFGDDDGGTFCRFRVCRACHSGWLGSRISRFSRLIGASQRNQGDGNKSQREDLKSVTCRPIGPK